jgi:eukaryotic-like serine/threonine-protein kinase
MITCAYIDGNLPSLTEVDLPRFLLQTRSTIRATRTGSKARTTRGNLEPAHDDVFHAGDLLSGTYEIRRKLGSGGMGQVFAAHDHRLNRLVAIKVGWPTLPRDPLRREAQVLAAFRHPGLVTVYGLSEHHGIDYIVMERLAGESLAERLKRELPEHEECESLLARICEPLAALHAAGLAHADLKPGNIMLTPPERVVLLDLGIARIEQLRGDRRLVSGSPHFMAPETIRGDVRAGEAYLVDLYALGVIAYVMLTGEAPFDHADPVEIMVQHVQTPAPRVSVRCPSVSRSLDDLTAALLAKRPEDRPASIEEVLASLMPHQRVAV